MWLHASNRQDKNNVFERIFYIKRGHLRGKQERCFRFSSMGWVLESPQHFRSKISLSLVGVENPDKHRTQRELTRQNGECDQKYRSRVI